MNRVLVFLLLIAPALARAAPEIQQTTLPNGLTVLVVEDHGLPLVTVEIAARNGAMTESPAYNGLSHLYEHMFFKANKVLPSQEAWLARAHELGLQWNGSTNTERVNYFFTTTKDHLSDTMKFMHDAIVYPLFDQKELERERVVVTGEIDRNEASPFYHLFHDVEQRVWWKYPSRKDPLGLRATVLKTTRAQMETIKNRYYVPNNSALVVTGDVSADEIFAMADKLYVDWARGADPFVKFPLVTHPPIQKTEAVVVVQPVRVIDGQLVWHGPSTVGPSVPDTYAADALGEALRLPSSRFQKALVDSGACISVGFGWYTQMNTGPITANFEATPEKVDTCIKTLRGELAKMTSEYVTQEDLSRGAHELEVQTVQERERPSELAHTLTFWWTSAGLDYYLHYVDNLYKVTPADAARYIATYITNKPFVLGVMVSPEMAKKNGLDSAHFQKLVTEAP
jgi:zinc protease